MATDRLFNQTQGDSLLSILAQIRDGYNSVDGAFSLTSENPLQNKKITGAVTDTIETLGGTAQKSYAIGQYFLANDGYYYVATAAITAGSSNISSSTGGNCSKTCITAAMNNLSSQISNLTSKIAWKLVEAVDITTVGTSNTMNIPSDALEILVVVGEKNNYQVYGGKSFIIPNNTPGMCLLVTGELLNGGGNTLSSKGVYLYYDINVLTYKAFDFLNTLRMRVYYR